MYQKRLISHLCKLFYLDYIVYSLLHKSVNDCAQEIFSFNRMLIESTVASPYVSHYPF